MNKVILTGYLKVPLEDLEAVVIELPRHIVLTRAEPGCQRFDVEVDSNDPTIFYVNEEFADSTSFRCHQDRVGSSKWGEVTVNAERNYKIEEIQIDALEPILFRRSIDDGGSANGSVNEVMRRGDSVLRPMGHWSPNVHELLTFLEKKHFNYSPRFQGIEEGRERLSYIHGEVALRPWPEILLSLSGLKQIAEMLRHYHDVVKQFQPQQSTWHLSDRELTFNTIIRHGDVGPWNMV